MWESSVCLQDVRLNKIGGHSSLVSLLWADLISRCINTAGKRKRKSCFFYVVGLCKKTFYVLSHIINEHSKMLNSVWIHLFTYSKHDFRKMSFWWLWRHGKVNIRIWLLWRSIISYHILNFTFYLQTTFRSWKDLGYFLTSCFVMSGIGIPLVLFHWGIVIKKKKKKIVSIGREILTEYIIMLTRGLKKIDSMAVNDFSFNWRCYHLHFSFGLLSRLCKGKSTLFWNSVFSVLLTKQIQFAKKLKDHNELD